MRPHCIRERKGQFIRLGWPKLMVKFALRVSRRSAAPFVRPAPSPIPKFRTGRCLADTAFLIGAMAMICVFMDFTSFLNVDRSSGNRKSRHFKIKKVTALSNPGKKKRPAEKAGRSALNLFCFVQIRSNSFPNRPNENAPEGSSKTILSDGENRPAVALFFNHLALFLPSILVRLSYI